MVVIYPIVIDVDDDGYHVTAPDFRNHTFGSSLEEALSMASDMICGLMDIMEEDGQEIPTPSPLKDFPQGDNVISTLVTADLDAFRAKYDMRAVRKNCTIPQWLNKQAEAAHINFSEVLQEGLKQKLGIV